MIKLKILTLFCSLFLISQLYADEKYKTTNSTNTHLYKNLDYLLLDDTQEEEIKEILIDSKKKFSKYYKKKQKAQKKLQKLMQEEHFDKDEYEDTAEDIVEEAIELEAKIFKQIHKVLTPAQREQFSYYLQEWKIE